MLGASAGIEVAREKEETMSPGCSKFSKIAMTGLVIMAALVAVLAVSLTGAVAAAEDCDHEEEEVAADDDCDDDCDSPCSDDEDGQCDCPTVCNACGCCPSVVSAASVGLCELGVSRTVVRGNLPVLRAVERRGIALSVFKPPRHFSV